jgi:hypothetical protein
MELLLLIGKKSLIPSQANVPFYPLLDINVGNFNTKKKSL